MVKTDCRKKPLDYFQGNGPDICTSSRLSNTDCYTGNWHNGLRAH